MGLGVEPPARRNERYVVVAFYVISMLRAIWAMHSVVIFQCSQIQLDRCEWPAYHHSNLRRAR